MKHYTEVIIGTGILSLFIAGMFGSFGSLVHYLYITAKDEEEFSRSLLFRYMIMGAFVGILVHFFMVDFLEKSYPAVILVSGFLTVKLLDFLDINGINMLLRNRK